MDQRKIFIRKTTLFSGVFLAFLIISLFLGSRFHVDSEKAVDDDQFRQTHLEKREILNDYMEQFRDTIHQQGLDGVDPAFYSDMYWLFEEHGLAFFIYEGHDLRYWSVNNIPLPEMDTLKDESVTRLGNGWYYIRQMRADSFRVMGVEQIRRDYSYENQYLKNEFQADYHLPGQINIVKDPSRGAAIHDEKGEYLFSLYPVTYQQGKSLMFYVSIGVFLLALLFLMLTMNQAIRIPKTNGGKLILLCLTALLFPGDGGGTD